MRACEPYLFSTTRFFMKSLPIIAKFFYLLASSPLHAQEQTPNNLLEIMHQNQLLSHNDLLLIQTEIINELMRNESKLLAIHKSSGSLVEKWQDLLQLILSVQMEAIKPYNLGERQAALSRFGEEYARGAAESVLLAEMNKKKWLYLFEKAFGVAEFEEISLVKAQELIAHIGEEMTAEPFLKKIDEAVISLPPNASLFERRKAVLKVLIPLHLSVMAQYGFEGDRGYIQAQRAIMDYYHDPLIAQVAAQAQSIVFKRARLIP